MLFLLPWLACLALVLVSARADAQTPIHRCIGADGNPVFTDQPCAALGATAVARGAAGRDDEAPRTPAVRCASSPAQL
ncbi:MAG: DUF4124 domain-containing protein, partial [Rhodanobacter sp.]